MSSNSYYTVISSAYYNKNIENLFHNLLEEFLNDYVRNFGKFTVPITDITSSELLSTVSIHEFLYNIVSKLFSFKLIEASNKFYLFEACTVYFNINWQTVNDSIEFSVFYGFHYDIDYEKNSAYVYCIGDDDDDECDTIIGCQESSIEEIESDSELVIEGDDFDY